MKRHCLGHFRTMLEERSRYCTCVSYLYVPYVNTLYAFGIMYTFLFHHQTLLPNYATYPYTTLPIHVPSPYYSSKSQYRTSALAQTPRVASSRNGPCLLLCAGYENDTFDGFGWRRRRPTLFARCLGLETQRKHVLSAHVLRGLGHAF